MSFVPIELGKAAAEVVRRHYNRALEQLMQYSG
jgi:hypothetical protein